MKKAYSKRELSATIAHNRVPLSFKGNIFIRNAQI